MSDDDFRPDEDATTPEPPGPPAGTDPAGAPATPAEAGTTRRGAGRRTKLLAATGVALVVLGGGIGAAAALTGGGSHGTSATPPTTVAPYGAAGAGAPGMGASAADGVRAQVRRAVVASIVQTLGVTPKELHADVVAGQTVAQIAQAKGIAPAAVVQAATAAGNQALQQAQQAGTLEPAQVAKAQQRLGALVDRYVNDTAAVMHRAGRPAGGGPTTTAPAPVS